MGVIKLLQRGYKKSSVRNSMKKALYNGEIKVFYQPKIEAGSTRVIGAEALVRWQKPDGSFIYPDMFIPALEENGSIVDLDFFVYEQVFKTLQERISAGKPIVPVSMNVSRAHLKDGRIYSYIKDLFKKYHVHPKYTEFELTESMYVQNIDKILTVVKEFREKGGRISMDDFGSGYSSLNLLTDLPIDTLKVDKVFLKNEHLNENEKTVLSCVIEMAKKLRMDVVCEGVETEEQSRFLSLLGCDMFQGFLYAKALPMEEYYDYLETHLETEINEVHFGFDGHLKDDTGMYQGIVLGDNITFCDGPVRGMGGLHFGGGEPMHNSVELPAELLKNDSFSINMWLKEEYARLWTSAYYVGYENGFCSIMPRGWDMKLNFRIKDSSDHDGWYDVGNQTIKPQEWIMVTACYNSANHVSTVYINGERTGLLNDVINLVSPKNILIGGDIYAKGFEGCVADLSIFDQPLSFETVKKMYERVKEKQKEDPEWQQRNRRGEKLINKRIPLEELHYSLNGTLKESNGELELLYNGKELSYEEGPWEGSLGVTLKGGNAGENVLILPKIPERMDGYTISYWIKDENPRPWVSSFYAGTEHGFMSEIPITADGKSMYRLKDVRRETEWRDTIWERFMDKGKWHHVVIIYQKDIRMIAHYVDGKSNGIKDDCFDIGQIKQVIFGGDVFTMSFEGAIADIHIYNQPLEIEEVMERTER